MPVDDASVRGGASAPSPDSPGAGAAAETGVEAGAGAPLQPSRARKQVLLRLDPAVHGAIAKWAADDLRSVNAQIEVILRGALRDAGREVRPQPMRGRGRPRKADGEVAG